MTDFWNDYYKSLEGATIVKFAGMNDTENGDWFPCFQVKFANGKNGFIEISQDPEGNGGGFIFGLEMPAKWFDKLQGKCYTCPATPNKQTKDKNTKWEP